AAPKGTVVRIGVDRYDVTLSQVGEHHAQKRRDRRLADAALWRHDGDGHAPPESRFGDGTVQAVTVVGRTPGLASTRGGGGPGLEGQRGGRDGRSRGRARDRRLAGVKHRTGHSGKPGCKARALWQACTPPLILAGGLVSVRSPLRSSPLPRLAPDVLSGVTRHAVRSRALWAGSGFRAVRQRLQVQHGAVLDLALLERALEWQPRVRSSEDPGPMAVAGLPAA